MKLTRAASTFFSLTLLASAITAGQATAPTTRDLTQASIEDLLDMQVTSVSKKEQKLSHASAAVFVITQEDIRRSGATDLPDVLRLAPGVSVARINASNWAISIRGFSDLYGNKVLVVIDGRSVYSPSFSGVLWDQQQLPLEDIERVEIIRGPGGTVWGANAVNGVINIITKRADASGGGLVSVAAGSEAVASGLLQYSGKLASNGAYRLFGRYFNNQSTSFGDGSSDADGWHSSQGGFRTDWELSPHDALTVQGDLSQAVEGETGPVVALPPTKLTTRTSFDAGNLLTRWTHTRENGSSMSLQFYYDRSDRWQGALHEVRNTEDVDFQYHQSLGSRQDVVWGLGLRASSTAISPSLAISFVPAQRTDGLYSAFFQDEIRLGPAVSLTVGSKLEHNSYTGLAVEPSAQLLWTPTARQSVWFSVSRAIRQPSLTDLAVRADLAIVPLGGGATGLVKLSGTPNPKVEDLRDIEAGYRVQAGRFSLDADAFLSRYHHIETTEPGTPYFALSPAPPHLVLPEMFDYKAQATSWGGELSANWTASSRWKLSAGYSLLRMSVTRDASSGDTLAESIPGHDPRHQFQIRSFLNLGHNWEWDNTIAYVGARPSLGVPGYTRADTRLGWRVSESVELSISGRNLLRPSHEEYFYNYPVNNTQVERDIVGKITWHF